MCHRPGFALLVGSRASSPLPTDAMPADYRPVADGPADPLPPAASPADPADQAEPTDPAEPADPARPAGRLAERLTRPMLLLTGWTAIWFAILARNGGIAWLFFVKGSSLLFNGTYNGHNRPGFLHIYASYPGFQIGPLAFGVAQVIRNLIPGQPIGRDQNVVLAQLIMSAMGLLTLVVIRRIALVARPELATLRSFRRTFLVGGAAFMIAWMELAVAFGHLDDSLALLLAAGAVLTAIQGHPVLTGLAIGLATDAKPWALIFLPVLLLAGGRTRWRTPDQPTRPIRDNLHAWMVAAACAAAVIAAAWLPFFIAVPRTVRALHYTIVNMQDSALHVIGVDNLQTPHWDRQAQILLAGALALIAIGRGRWPAVLLLGAGARIALDPGVHSYYTPGVMVGALLWDLLGSRRPLPVWTIISFCALNLVPLLTRDQHLRGDFRFGLIVAFTLAILAGPSRWVWRPASAAGRADPPASPEPAGATA